LVVVGHKDHGKSTLIGRLLYDSGAIPEQKLREIREEIRASGKEFEFAYIMDSLEEERTGGLTIDIMQTPFRSGRYDYVIIDCPGHREFIRKMLTGASQADAAILVVSAVDGVEDQTRQHAFLVKTLGIKQLVVVAVNKMDLAGYSEEAFRSVSGEVRELLSSLGYGDVPVVPVSAFTGDNVVKSSGKMSWYCGKTLIETLDDGVRPSEAPSELPLRCVIQDIYRMRDKDLVICKVETGVLREGQEVLVLPLMRRRVVESVESFGMRIAEAVPGDSVGLILSEAGDLKRGYVLADVDERLSPVSEFIAELIVFEELTLRVGGKVRIYVGTAEVECEIERIFERINPIQLTVEERDAETIRGGDVGEVLFRPLEPLYLERYSEFPQLGRFVVLGKRGVEAAGIVLNKK